jgi:DNA-binding GntR family transcriptional regulator
LSLPTNALEMVRAERAAIVLQLLSGHIGRANGVHERELVTRTQINGREVRKAIERLRLDGVHVCGKPDSGYYIAATPAELEETFDFLEKRATKTFRQLAAMKRVGLPALYQQMSLRESAQAVS